MLKAKKRQPAESVTKQNGFKEFTSCVKRNKGVYLFLVPGLLLTIIFNYLPMLGISYAFMDYDILKGFASPFIGLANFQKLFTVPEFFKAIVNTVTVSGLNILIGFPLPIIFALMMNEIKEGAFKKFAQSASYLPHFLSTIAVIGLATTIYGSNGIINDLRVALGGPDTERKLFLTMQNFFVPNIIILEVWKALGWSSIIYMAAMSGIDEELYNAAVIDGAGKFRQCIHITLPGISSTVIMLFILKMGSLFKSNFDLIYGLQNVFIDFEVISTVVYKQGITNGDYAMSTALSLFEGLISLFLVLGTNFISKKVNDTSII